MKKLFLFVLLVIVSACSTFRQEKPYFEQRIDSLLVSDFFLKANISISTIDAANNKTILSFNDRKLMRPASNQKILTTASSLYFLGSNYNFSTSLFCSGNIDDSTCNDLYVVGSFDPDFTIKDLNSLVQEIKNAGIKKINGNLYADISNSDSLYFGDGWVWNDEPDTYMPYLSQLAINKNSLTIIFEPDSVGKPARISFNPKNNFIELKNNSMTVQNGKSTFQVTRDWLNHNNNIIASGYLPINSKRDSVEVSIREPHFFFLNLLKERLIAAGVQFDGEVGIQKLPAQKTKLSTIERNIIPVIINTNKVSDNLSAEMLLRALAGIKSEKHSAQNGIVMVDSLIKLAGANPKDYRIADGSGLSYYNLVSAELLTKVLTFIKNQKEPFPSLFIKSLPIGGIDGTLANRFKNSPARNHVFAKTGTISGVSSLSGFINTKKNNWIIFSIFIQNFVGSSKQARDIQDKICEIIYEEL